MSKRRDVLLLSYKRRRGGELPVVRASPYRVIYFATMLVLIGLAGWLYLHQASQVAAYARTIREQEWEKERLHRDMVALRAEIAQLRSFTRLQEFAERHGYELPSARERSRSLALVFEAPSEPVASPGESPLIPELAPEVARGFLRQVVAEFEQWLRTPVEE
ncbi:MAG: hypothetical protein FJZ90_15810 [Chloroflexi bacterium]|nr:hypothetical protein [Chloroflexota bacterium]